MLSAFCFLLSGASASSWLESGAREERREKSEEKSEKRRAKKSAASRALIALRSQPDQHSALVPASSHTGELAAAATTTTAAHLCPLPSAQSSKLPNIFSRRQTKMVSLQDEEKQQQAAQLISFARAALEAFAWLGAWRSHDNASIRRLLATN